MLKYLPLLLVSTTVFAQKLSVVSVEYNYQDAPEFKAILAELKLHGEFSSKTSVDPAPKKMTRGEQVVAEAKARNRAIIAAQSKTATTTDEALTDLEKLKLEDQKTRDGWKKEVQDQLGLWQKEQKIFLGKLKVYKENTFEIPAPKEKIVEKSSIPNLPDVKIVNGAFSVPIRDQAARPTCSAFAGIRAIEIILAQNNVSKDLSEQYFYWASKPDCQKTRCAQKGSWVTSAFKHSQSLPQVDIPVEANCEYLPLPIEKNETHIPLPSACTQGSAKIEKFKEVKALADVIESLRSNVPVIVAAKLSENFYKNQGLVTLADASKSSGAGLDAHSLGHAFLAVGVMELPEKLKLTEGSYCIVVANSWGKGWGSGGYSCLTQNWFTKYRQPAPFVAVTEVSVK